MLQLDPWQQEIIKHRGNKIICSGRQTGKTTIAAIDAAEFAVEGIKRSILIISVTEDQAQELLLKVQLYILYKYPKWIRKGRDRKTGRTVAPTKNSIHLTNGSIIRTKAVGQSGIGARGFTIHRLIADEAAFMPEDVWPAVTPMLLTTGGDIVLISTPHGRKNFFHKCYHDPNFKVWHINTMEVIEKREISGSWSQFQRDKAMEYFESEKYRLSEKEFAQEYLGLFVDDLNDFFPDEYLKKSMIQQKVEYAKENQDFIIGIDIGRMGGDKTVFTIFEKRGDLLIMREKIIWNEAYLDRIAQQVIEWDKTWNFRRILLDNGGIGIGVFDMLYNTPGFKKRVKGINNSEVVIEYDQNGKEKKRKWLKEETYANLLFLMMKGRILLFDDSDIWLSLKSTQYEYINQRGGAMMKINHTDHKLSHLTESIVRSAMASKEKINKLFISYI